MEGPRKSSAASLPVFIGRSATCCEGSAPKVRSDLSGKAFVQRPWVGMVDPALACRPVRLGTQEGSQLLEQALFGLYTVPRQGLTQRAIVSSHMPEPGLVSQE